MLNMINKSKESTLIIPHIFYKVKYSYMFLNFDVLMLSWSVVSFDLISIIEIADWFPFNLFCNHHKYTQRCMICLLTKGEPIGICHRTCLLSAILKSVGSMNSGIGQCHEWHVGDIK